MWNILIGLCFYNIIRESGYNYGKDKKLIDNKDWFFSYRYLFFFNFMLLFIPALYF